MKGISLFSDIFTLFILIICVILMGAILLIFTQAYMINSSLGVISPRQATVNVFYKPVSYQSSMLAFLEMQYKGIPVKKIMNAVAIQKSNVVWLPEADEFIDVEQLTKSYLGQVLLGGGAYILKIRDPEIIIASAGDSMNWQKVSTELFLMDGEPVDLELYVG